MINTLKCATLMNTFFRRKVRNGYTNKMQTSKVRFIIILTKV